MLYQGRPPRRLLTLQHRGVTFVAFSALVVSLVGGDRKGSRTLGANLFLGHIVVVVRVEGPVGVIERKVFVLLPVDISAATRCL